MERQLGAACKNGTIGDVRKLLSSVQINTNYQDFFGSTPFYNACAYGQIEVVKLLLKDERIDVNKPKNDGATPFYIACQEGYSEIVKLLLNDERVDIHRSLKTSSRNDGETPFFVACECGDIEVVKVLLSDARIEINRARSDGQTPISVACENGHIEVVKYVLASGREVNLNVQDKFGKTALDITREKVEEKKFFQGEDFQRRKRNFANIIELLESFERNQNQTRTRLRIQLGVADYNFENQKLEEEMRKIDEERKKLEEDKKEIEEEKKKIEQRKEEMEEMEKKIEEEKKKLEEERKIQESKGKPTEYFQLKNWNEMIFLSQGPNSEFRIEIDSDELQNKIKPQMNEMMDKFSKLETCIRFQTTSSNIVFRLEFVIKSRAEKTFDQIVELLESTTDS